jgi:hypothetical protein
MRPYLSCSPPKHDDGPKGIAGIDCVFKLTAEKAAVCVVVASTKPMFPGLQVQPCNSFDPVSWLSKLTVDQLQPKTQLIAIFFCESENQLSLAGCLRDLQECIEVEVLKLFKVQRNLHLLCMRVLECSHKNVTLSRRLMTNSKLCRKQWFVSRWTW